MEFTEFILLVVTGATIGATILEVYCDWDRYKRVIKDWFTSIFKKLNIHSN